MQKNEQINDFVTLLSEWYSVHRRELPWRDVKMKNPTERAYRVLISEIMLQQTQVPRVIGSYKKFVQSFPTIKALAAASNGEVLMVWRGMGYNSRALRLRDAAKTVQTTYNGKFPSEMKDLLSIKGIGHYTAGAIRTFAFDLPTPVIDTNVRRVLHRTFFGNENADGTWKTSDKVLLSVCEKVFNRWLEERNSGSDFLSALMDYGSLVQTKTSPKWNECVLFHSGIMKAKPMKNEKAKKRIVRSEPGRMVAGKFIPNRIFRGRIVETLRDHPQGLIQKQIGDWISPDYSQEHEAWLSLLIKKLIQDGMLQKKGIKFFLAS